MENSELNNIGQIKSNFILKKIFSLVCLKTKLDIIINNKSLQNKFDYTIEDYKNLSKRYKKYDTNGKVKEYLISSDILVFEGEYLNGKRNGEGKEYYSNGSIKFKGEYLHGKNIPVYYMILIILRF